MTFRFEIVPASPAAFLLIMLQRLRHSRVNHIAHIIFVDAHPERDCRNDNIHFLPDKRFLILHANIRIHPGMIRQCVVTFVFQCFAKPVDIRPSNAIYYSRFIFIYIEYFAYLPEQVVSAFHPVNEIWSVE